MIDNYYITADPCSLLVSRLSTIRRRQQRAERVECSDRGSGAVEAEAGGQGGNAGGRRAADCGFGGARAIKGKGEGKGMEQGGVQLGAGAERAV